MSVTVGSFTCLGDKYTGRKSIVKVPGRFILHTGSAETLQAIAGGTSTNNN